MKNKRLYLAFWKNLKSLLLLALIININASYAAERVTANSSPVQKSALVPVAVSEGISESASEGASEGTSEPVSENAPEDTLESNPESQPKPTKAKPSNNIITIETKVKGSSEQPKILTLVPWQAPKAPVGLYIPMTQTLPTNIFQPVSKDSLDRLVKIYQPVIPLPVKQQPEK
jgi:hypothetical protein